MTLNEKRDEVLRLLRAAAPHGRLGVAFSGGVDSALLLALARDALGPERVVAITARSESLAKGELALCQQLTATLGVTLLLLRTHELERAGYRENSPERCYHCKAELFERISAEISEREGIVAVAYGATTEDLGDHRPGMRAAAERGALAPLLEAGLDKAEVRRLSRELGLPTWDKPAQPCLASRIPYGQPVTAETLARIEEAERCLAGLGFRELRVRHHEEGGSPLARIELGAADLPRLLEPGLREQIATELKALGFQYVALDLEGFRSGRLNEVLAPRSLPVMNQEA